MTNRERVKCANCSKPVDPTSEEFLCDACIGRQQVIEAIAKEFCDADCNQTEGVPCLRASPCGYALYHAKQILDKHYPSGQPMIGMLKEDQSAACTHLEDNLGEGKGMVTVDYCNGRASLIEQNFKRILPQGKDGGK